MSNYNTTFHQDGTVTYWSVYNQRWIKDARIVSNQELAAMSKQERNQVIEHLKTQKQEAVCPYCGSEEWRITERDEEDDEVFCECPSCENSWVNWVEY
jgi:DNA-directed RNA polymerase subunit M/transcription elongation factor TFIIS